MSFIFLLLVSLFYPGESKELIKKLTNPAPLTSSVLISGEKLELFVTGLDRFGTNGLIIFAQKEKLVKYYDLNNGILSTFARSGEGPGEFRDGYVLGSVVNDLVVVQEWATRQTKAINQRGESWIAFETRWPIRSLIPLSERYVVGMLANPGMAYWNGNYTKKKLPNDSMILFEKGENGHSWNFHGTFYNEDFADEFDFDSIVGIRTNLYPIRNTTQFYRVPFQTSPVFQIMDVSGQVVRELPLPHPLASEIPNSVAARLKLYREKNVKYIIDASVDRFGKLHLVLANIRDVEVDYSRRLGVVIDEFGTVERAFLLDRPIKRLVVSEDGSRYFGVDAEEDALLVFQIPPEE